MRAHACACTEALRPKSYIFYTGPDERRLLPNLSSRVGARDLTNGSDSVTCTDVLDDSAPYPDATVRQREPGTVTVSVQGDEPVSLVNVQVPHFTEAEIEAAEREQVKRAGPLVTRMKARIDESWSVVRTDLAERAGGKASIRAQLLGHYALKANMALELQALMAESLAGRDKEGSDKAFRSLAGLSVVAADLLNKAYAAATEEGKAKAAKLEPVDALMATLGVTGGQGERSEVVSTRDGGGGSTLGPPTSNSKPSRKKGSP